MRRRIWLIASILPAMLHAQARTRYDLVILGGRVMDPASGLHAVRNVAIAGGRVAAITTGRIAGRDTIDARGLVVAPGFVDLHSHGQDEESYRYYAMDGVATALDLELGVGPIAAFYEERTGHALVNFGGSASHPYARRVATRQPLANFYRDRWIDTSTASAYARATPALIDSVRAEIERELDEGALAVGIGVPYTPGASPLEIYRMFEICAERRVICFTHVRAGLAGAQEVVANAMTTHAALHVVHANSSSGARVGDPDAPAFMRTIREARRHGVDVTTEAYPYTAASTALQSAIYDEFMNQPDADYSKFVWVPTGEHLTRESFLRYRRIGGPVVELGGPDSLLYPIFRDSMVMVASDAVPYLNHRGNPRLAGTHAKVLGRYVREQHLFSLMEGLRRMTIMPAQRMERSVPQMRTKGRLARDMDADVVIFDPARIIDRATVEEPARYSEGVEYLLVNGTPVVRKGALVENVHPGIGIRRSIRASSP